MIRLSVVLALTALGCSSSETPSNPGDAGNSLDGSSSDSGVLPDGTSAETQGPLAGPCDEEPGKAKFCVTLKVSGDRPGALAPTDMAIDGKGKAYLALYDKDPSLPGAKLIRLVEEPRGERAMDSGFLAQLTGELPPGVYSAIGFFADSTNQRGLGTASVLAGDYVTPQTNVGKTFTYPKIALTAGKVFKNDFDMKAIRRLTVRLTPSPSLAGFGTSVHGSGPVFLGLTDATSIKSDTTWVHFDIRGCVNLNIQGLAPTGGSAEFAVTVTGTRNVYAGVIDYDADTPEFPGRGSLITAQSGTLAQVTIDPMTWTATASVNIVDLAFEPVEPSRVDPTPQCN